MHRAAGRCCLATPPPLSAGCRAGRANLYHHDANFRSSAAKAAAVIWSMAQVTISAAREPPAPIRKTRRRAARHRARLDEYWSITISHRNISPDGIRLDAAGSPFDKVMVTPDIDHPIPPLFSQQMKPNGIWWFRSARPARSRRSRSPSSRRPTARSASRARTSITAAEFFRAVHQARRGLDQGHPEHK